MKYYIQNQNSKNTFLLFHGTGGTYRDLLSIAQFIDPKSNLVAFEGPEVENGARRFFKRYAIGQFDIENLELNTSDLNKDIEFIKKDPNFATTNLIGMGFSNGANILESLTVMYPHTLKNIVLLSPVYVRKDLKFKDLNGVNILIITSLNDPYSTEDDTKQLINDLKQSGANLDVFLHNDGHRLTQEALNYTKTWYLNLFK